MRSIKIANISFSHLVFLFIIGESARIILPENMQIAILLVFSFFKLFKLKNFNLRGKEIKFYFISLMIIIGLTLVYSFTLDSLISLKSFYLALPVFVVYIQRKNLEKIFIEYKQIVITLIFILVITHFLGFEKTEEIVFSAKGYVKTSSYLKLAINESILLGIYILFKFREKRKISYLVSSIILFSIPHVANFEIQRTILIASLISISIVLGVLDGPFRIRAFSPKPIIIFSLLILILTSLYISTASAKEKIDSIISIYQNINNLSEIGDSSIGGRIKEIELIFNTLVPNPILGNGYFRLSTANEIFDQRFFLADIGIFGVYYTLGTFGLLIYGVQIISFFKLMRYNNPSILFLTFRCFLGYLLVITLAQGTSIHNIALFLLVFICAKKYQENGINNNYNSNLQPREIS